MPMTIDAKRHRAVSLAALLFASDLEGGDHQLAYDIAKVVAESDCEAVYTATIDIDGAIMLITLNAPDTLTYTISVLDHWTQG